MSPIDALAAAISSILIVLTLTLAFTVIEHWPEIEQPLPPSFGVDLFYAGLGAATAGALIDGVMMILLSLLERGEKHRFLQTLQAAGSDEESMEVIAEELDTVLEPIAGEARRRELYADVLEHLRDSQPQPVGMQREDFVEALGAALVAFLAVLPALAPLWLLRDYPLTALRSANIVSFITLFILGFLWGRYTSANPWKIGVLLVLVGALLVAIAIPLGG